MGPMNDDDLWATSGEGVGGGGGGVGGEVRLGRLGSRNESASCNNNVIIIIIWLDWI